jgi:hypothetical protein
MAISTTNSCGVGAGRGGGGRPAPRPTPHDGPGSCNLEPHTIDLRTSPLMAVAGLLVVPILLSSWLAPGVPRAAPSGRRSGIDVQSRSPAVIALADGEWEVTSGVGGMTQLHVSVAGKEMRFESGEMARQANGAVTMIQGDTHVFCAACFERKADLTPIDFTPLRVDYFERKSSVGATAGGFIKRDGRPSEHETLVARLIDRPIRPLIKSGWSLETQLTAYVLACDPGNVPDVMAVCAASASLALSEVPFPKPIAAVRVGYVPAALVSGGPAESSAEDSAATDDGDEEFDDEMILAEDGGTTEATEAEEEKEEKEEEERVLVVNPTREQMAQSTLNLVIAGTVRRRESSRVRRHPSPPLASPSLPPPRPLHPLCTRLPIPARPLTRLAALDSTP